RRRKPARFPRLLRGKIHRISRKSARPKNLQAAKIRRRFANRSFQKLLIYCTKSRSNRKLFQARARNNLCKNRCAAQSKAFRQCPRAKCVVVQAKAEKV